MGELVFSSESETSSRSIRQMGANIFAKLFRLIFLPVRSRGRMGSQRRKSCSRVCKAVASSFETAAAPSVTTSPERRTIWPISSPLR